MKSRYHKANERKLRIPTASVGTIGELRVACDLLERGFEVFRSVSASASCDLAVLWKGKLLRIEVKTQSLYMRTDGTTGTFRLRRGDASKYDIWAAILPDRIIYDPDLSTIVGSTRGLDGQLVAPPASPRLPSQ